MDTPRLRYLPWHENRPASASGRLSLSTTAVAPSSPNTPLTVRGGAATPRRYRRPRVWCLLFAAACSDGTWMAPSDVHVQTAGAGRTARWLEIEEARCNRVRRSVSMGAELETAERHMAIRACGV